MQDKTSNHAPIPTELNIAPRGKSWFHGQLIDGEQGHPTRQSMESADRTQPPEQAAPAAVALPDDLAVPTTWMLVEDLVQAECNKARLHQEYMGKAMPADVYERFQRTRDEIVPALREHVYARLAATPAAAAPVVLPEPIGAMSATTPRAVAWNCTFMPEGGTRLFTEQQVRALLATATGLHAQAVEQSPVLYISKEQLDSHTDHADSEAGRYLPCRITPAGKFTTPLFAAPHALTPAARDVLAERLRQITQEGYDPQHDDDHVNDEIAAMAALFMMPEGAREWDATSTSYGDTLAEAILPSDWEMPNFGDDRRRQLVKGTAMGLAEIERIDRAAIAAAKGE